MNNLPLIQFIAHKAYLMRANAIRMTTRAQSGHPTSVLSAADIVAALFFYAMRFDPKQSRNPNNDHFILSKGHAAPVLYTVWKELGQLTQEELMTYRDFNSPLEGHPTPRFEHVEIATGSLGQGLGAGLGMILAGRLDNFDYRVWVLLGDSELAEGSVWEAAELAAYYKTDHLIAIVDINRLGQTGSTIEGHDIERHARKFAAFGWHTITVDGHDIAQLCAAYDEAQQVTGKPIVILAKTIKGYGVARAEDKNGFHGKAFEPEEMDEILRELAARFAADAAYKSSFAWQPSVRTAPMPTQIFNEEEESTGVAGARADIRCFNTVEAMVPARLQPQATRHAYGEALAALGTVNPNIVSLDGEVKNSTFAELFEAQHPDRFFQCFIAEQNMISMGIGMAVCGKIPFCSTFASFITRAFDQLRMAGIGCANIKVVGSHAGVSIGQDGPSQMGLEDIAMMRTIPGSIVLYPCDAMSTWKMVELLAAYHGIGYLRTTRPETPVIYESTTEFKIGGCHVLKSYDNAQACIIAAGYTVFEALKAHDTLRTQNILVNVIDLYSIKPLDRATVIETARRSNNRIITVEDHYLAGGIGEAVCYEVRNEGFEITCLAVSKIPRSGKPEELYAYEEIDAKAIIAAVKG